MNQPTAEQVIAAANGGCPDVRRALEKLYPEAFEKPIKAGEVYNWGTGSDGGSGLVVDNGSSLDFIHFHEGYHFLTGMSYKTTKSNLTQVLNSLDSRTLHNCYTGILRGPKRFKSWKVK